MTTTIETVGTFERDSAIAGTSLQGYITATREQLETVFGQSGNGDGGYKVFYNWGLRVTENDGTKTIAHIYDWKYENAPGYKDCITWNIGGLSAEAVRVVSAILCEQLQVPSVMARVR
jgi:hypothetical protein